MGNDSKSARNLGGLVPPPFKSMYIAAIYRGAKLVFLISGGK